MTELGRVKIKEAKENGQWEKADQQDGITSEQISCLEKLLSENPLAISDFQQMSPSIPKTYTRAYLDAKTPAGKERRLA